MHRLFHIDEVLLITFSSFANNISDKFSESPCKENCQALRNLALTCSAFREPSLDVLWRTLVDARALFELLPEERLDYTGYRGSQLTAAHPLTQNDWIRLRSYATRIRSAQMYCSEPIDEWDYGTPSFFHHGFFQAIAHAYYLSNTGPLFPNLKNLVLRPAQGSDMNCLSLFLSPSLQQLELNIKNAVQTYEEDNISQAIGVACDLIIQSHSRFSISRLSFPALVDLDARSDVADPNPHGDIVKAYPRMLRSLQALTDLDIQGPLMGDRSTWNCVTQLPNLERLSVRGGLRFRVWSRELSFETSAFPKLHRLAGSCSILQTFLDKLSKGRLSSIDVLESEDDPAATRQVIQLVSQKCPGLLDCSILCGEIPKYPRLPSSTIFLKPILRDCRGLVRLSITVSTSFPQTKFNPSNDDYRTICQALPDLQSFTLRLSCVEGEEKTISPRTTLQASLETFATFCPKLHSLTLGSNFSWDAQISSPSKTFGSLLVLDMMSTTVEGETGDGSPKQVQKGENAVWKYLSEVGDGARILVKGASGE